MKFRKLTAAVLSVCMAGGAFTFASPEVSDYSITADAVGECYSYNSTTQTLTLKGNVNRVELWDFAHYDDIKTIRAAEGTILPADCSNLFGGLDSCTQVDLSNADVSNVTRTRQMFLGCKALTSVDLSCFAENKVTSMESMFAECSALTSVDLSCFDTSNVTEMYYMFAMCPALTSVDMSGCDTSNVTNMQQMFWKCSSLRSVDLSGFDTRNVKRFDSMFEECSSLKTLDLSSFDTSNATSMGYMFSECSELTSLDLSRFDTSKVKDMSSMFYSCSGLTALDISGFDTSKVTDMSGMFYNCSKLETLDLSSFDTSNVESADLMFRYCTDLSVLTLGKNFGDIAVGHELPNGNGWVNASAPSTVISGNAEFAEFKNTGGTYVKYGIDKKGDVNCDGEITVADVVRLQKWLLDVPGAILPYWQNADLCADEMIDVIDLCQMRRLLIEQNVTYTIRLEKVGEDITSLTSTISIINKYLGCGLGEAKNIVNSAPVTITDSATESDADQLVADLEGAGATVSVTKN